MTSGQARATIQSLTRSAIDELPRHYDGDKNWEKTKRIWAGVRFRREGMRITTKRRWKEVRHGLQTRYRIEFPGPESAPVPVQTKVRSVEFRPSTDGRPPRWAIDYVLWAPLDFSGRIERWNLGVQWYSVEVRGHLRIRLELKGTLSSYPDYSEIPPALVVDPKVVSATVHLEQLNLDRISKVGGEVAEQWGELAEKVIREILLDDVNDKLPAKLNKAIDRKRDRLRFSASDWIGNLTDTTP